VDPQPLIGIPPDIGFENFVEMPGISQDVVRKIAGIDQLNGRIETEAMSFNFAVPN